ncbi:hypothetical protein [Actinomadura sp. DC4]|uniref:hypothetical protein n=1 Tax=Actinomadura sp. DC4 TaxID=3055069 RepID=UPI0025B0F549|nr:hypothetical protein [Actinomadura sp. DC4]MDN3358913.1 hypothetical protein [Actinomadura sp. DC4]
MPEVIALLLDALVVALSVRGLAAERRGSRMISAAPSSAERQNGDPAAARDEEKCQTVICLADRAGRLSWFWVRASTGRGAVDLEYLGPARCIRATADRIACVLLPDGLSWEPAI